MRAATYSAVTSRFVKIRPLYRSIDYGTNIDSPEAARDPILRRAPTYKISPLSHPLVIYGVFTFPVNVHIRCGFPRYLLSTFTSHVTCLTRSRAPFSAILWEDYAIGTPIVTPNIKAQVLVPFNECLLPHHTNRIHR